ncbi:MAG TPA: ferritin [Syntrophomonadaceae bacterium]|nr:ferritin [Syntrophomonadaceae bacterium]
MLDKTIVDLLNQQINKELHSAYIYLDMANYYADEGLDGFDNWFTLQAMEERDHAMLIRTYLLNNGEKIVLTTIEQPDAVYTDFKEPLVGALEHERYITASINTIYKAAHDINDFRTMQFLNWFIEEQGEEEKNAEDLVTKYELFGKDGKGLYMLDSKLGERSYSEPTLVFD